LDDSLFRDLDLLIGNLQAKVGLLPLQVDIQFRIFLPSLKAPPGKYSFSDKILFFLSDNIAKPALKFHEINRQVGSISCRGALNPFGMKAI
jgi:hypothetical protein